MAAIGKLFDWILQREPPKDSPNTFVVVVLGTVGSGRSTFINAAIGKSKMKCGKDTGEGCLEAITKEVKDIRYKDAANREFLFIDTPGLDLEGTEPADIKDKANKRCANVDAIIYLHRVSDPRVTTPPEKYTKIFEILGGVDWEKKSMVIMTMCDRVTPEKASLREAEFSKLFWEGPQARGAKMDRFNQSSEDAWRLLRQLVPTTTTV